MPTSLPENWTWSGSGGPIGKAASDYLTQDRFFNSRDPIVEKMPSGPAE